MVKIYHRRVVVVVQDSIRLDLMEYMQSVAKYQIRIRVSNPGVCMTLTEKENCDSSGESGRPENWERISLEELPDPDYDEYSLPERDELERVPADEFHES